MLNVLCGRKSMKRDYKIKVQYSNFKVYHVKTSIIFKGSSGPKKEEDKVKTKAKKKKYITGAHGSGSARQKAKYREQRANRHSRKR